MRTITHTADDVRELRKKLKLTQRQFADALGVARRTIIRGEQRGLEIPYYSRAAWKDLQQKAADAPKSAARSRSDTSTIAKVLPRTAKARALATLERHVEIEGSVRRWAELAKLLRLGWRLQGFNVVSPDGHTRSAWLSAIDGCRARGLVDARARAKGRHAAGGDTHARIRTKVSREGKGWR